jgi:hypothetical protein
VALANVDTDRWVRCEAGDGGEGRSDRSDPTAQPTDRSGQGNVGPAEQVGGNFQALGRLHHGHALLNRIEQVWQSGGKEVRQQAERPMPLGTIPSRDAQPLWHQPWIAAVTGKRASTRRVQWTGRQSSCAPLLVPDVRCRTRSRMQRDLHRPSPRVRECRRNGQNYVESVASMSSGKIAPRPWTPDKIPLQIMNLILSSR